MCLLDSVVHWDDRTIRCTATSHRDLSNPLRSSNGLTSVHLCEYGAQAMAVHGGLLALRDSGGRAAPGLLAALREVEFAVGRIDDIAGTLTVAAMQQLVGGTGWLYTFEISVGPRWLARGRVSVIRP